MEKLTNQWREQTRRKGDVAHYVNRHLSVRDWVLKVVQLLPDNPGGIDTYPVKELL